MSHDVEKMASLQPPPKVEVSSVGASPRPSADGPRPGLRQTGKQHSFSDSDMLDFAGDASDTARQSLGCMYERIWSIKALLRWIRHFFPVAALLAIPVALFATVYADRRAGGVRLLGLFVWLEVVWGSLWFSKLVAMLMPAIFVFVSGIVNSGTRKHHPVVRRLETPISFLFWTIIAWATCQPVILAFDTKLAANPPQWVRTLQRVALASIAVSGMLLCQRFVIQLINVTYSAKQFTTRITESKRRVAMLDALYISSTRRFPPFCERFAQEDYTIMTGEVDRKDSSPGKLLAKVRMAGREVAQAFGQMTADISGNDTLFNPQSAHVIVTEALEASASSEALARRIWSSFAADGEALTQNDLEEAFPPHQSAEAEDLFTLLDADRNGDVSLEEMVLTVVDVGRERIAIWRGTHDIKSAVRVLDRFLGICVIAGTGLIYAAFFSQSFSTYLATIGTQLAAVSFAISGTVQEFLGSCIFIFVKHPFDVGDRVRINDQEMMVDKISLLYSVFRRIDNKRTCQVPNINLNSMWVENVSRSGALRERVTIQVAADTAFDEIERLRRRVRDELQSPANKRDFREDVDVELVAVADMSRLELQVEAEHKSNWHDERVRRTRRNRLVTSVVAGLREVGINAPGGGDATLGDEARPHYQVVVSEEAAHEARRRFKEGAVASRRLSAMSTGVDDGSSFLGVTRRA